MSANLDKTVMETTRSERNFSIVVPDHQYRNLQKMAHASGISLGAVCRQLLSPVDYSLYMQIQSLAFKENLTFPAMCKKLLEQAVKLK